MLHITFALFLLGKQQRHPHQEPPLIGIADINGDLFADHIFNHPGRLGVSGKSRKIIADLEELADSAVYAERILKCFNILTRFAHRNKNLKIIDQLLSTLQALDGCFMEFISGFLHGLSSFGIKSNLRNCSAATRNSGKNAGSIRKFNRRNHIFIWNHEDVFQVTFRPEKLR